MSNSKPVIVSENCYYASCESSPRWGIASSVEQKNPDGTDLTLFACDEHYETLTADLRSAGTRYSLFPINGPHIAVGPTTPEEDFEELIRGRSIFYKAFVYGTTILVGIVIAPILIVYHGGRWIIARMIRRPPNG